MSVSKIQELLEMKNFITANPKVVAYFYTKWCLPSTRFLPTIEEMAEYYPDVKFLMIDSEEKEGSKIADQAKVKIFPVSVFIKNGKAVYAVIGTDRTAIQEKLDIFSKRVYVPEPENYVQAEQLETYKKAKKENKIGVAIFFNYWSYWNNTSNFYFAKLAKKYPSIKFLKVGSLKNYIGWAGTKENFNTRPALIFYYDGKKKFIVEDDTRKFIDDNVKEFVDSLPKEDGVSNQPEIIIQSKLHEHPLKLILRNEVVCSVCGRDIPKKEKVFYCIECQYNLCKNCKAREDGHSVRQVETIKRMKDVNEIQNLVHNQKAVCIYVYEEYDEKIIEKITMFAQKYRQINFVRVRMDKDSQTLLLRYHLLQGKLYFIRDGSLVQKYTPDRLSSYCINDNIINFLGIGDNNSFVSKNDKHPLGKVEHLGFCCKVCRNVFPDDQFVVCYRCSKCMFDVCEYCKKFIK